MKQFNKMEKSWIMYDWANSVYYTIISVIFPIYFVIPVLYGGYGGTDSQWAFGTSIATLIAAILAPILGALADYEGMKKKLFTLFLSIGLLFTASLVFFNNPAVVVTGYIISYIGITCTILFYDSFLTDVTTVDKMDKLSSWGFAMGYIGGSTIPPVICMAMLMTMSNFLLAIKISIAMTVIWWGLFTIPFLRNVQQTHSLGKVKAGVAGDAFRNIWETLKSLVKRKGLFLFVLAYFFYIDGVHTVISVSTPYATQAGIAPAMLLVAVLAIQIIACVFSIFTAKLSEKFKPLSLILIGVAIYTVICFSAFYLGNSLEATDPYANNALVGAYGQKTIDAAHDLWLAGDVELSTLDSEGKAEIKAYFESVAEAQALYDAGDTELSSVAAEIREGVLSNESAMSTAVVLFWFNCFLIGTAQGGIQAISRSYFSKLVPPEKSNEYFGFFDIFGKFAAVLGPTLYGVFAVATGRSSYGMFSLVVLFIIGGLILIFGRKTMDGEVRTEEAQ